MESLKSPNNDCVTKPELLGKTVGSLICRRVIEAESEIVNESIEDMEENQTERDIVRTSELSILVMIRMKQQTIWLLMFKHEMTKHKLLLPN